MSYSRRSLSGIKQAHKTSGPKTLKPSEVAELIKYIVEAGKDDNDQLDDTAGWHRAFINDEHKQVVQREWLLDLLHGCVRAT